MRIDAFHLPTGVPTDRLTLIAGHDGVSAHAPVHSAADLDGVCTALLEARRGLVQMPVARVIAAIDAAARALRDPAEPARREALLGLTALTGYSPAMATHVLDRFSEDWLADALERLVTQELGGAAAVESFIERSDGSRSRAVAAPLGFHVFSGNVPGVNVTSIVRALLVRSAVLGKCATGEPVLTPVFARLLARMDPAVGACVAATWWPGGDTALEHAVLARAGLVVHYGSADSIASLRARAPADTRFVEHGPRMSFAIIAPDGLQEAGALQTAATALARAVAVFDQQGCVSPQLAYVIGSPAAGRAFAAAVAAALDELATSLPRGRLGPAEAAAVRDLRTRAEFRSIAGDDVELWAGANLGYSVIFGSDPAFEGTCLNRTLLVRSIPSLDDILEQVRPFGRFLQTVGVAGLLPQDLVSAAARLGEAGASRVVPLSAMPWPPPTWHHDGRGPLSELVRWVDLEI